jgi:hypothetical protein
MTRAFKAAREAGYEGPLRLEYVAPDGSKIIVSTGLAPTEMETPSLPPKKIVL